jgi:hypothetical protein
VVYPVLETIAIVAVVTVMALGTWWFWWQWPKRQVERLALQTSKERADAEYNFRKTVTQLLGGAAVLIGAGFALYQFLDQQKAAHDLLISNQVSKGFEQLASDKITMRLGGIYALEGVMNTSTQYRVPVLEALCVNRHPIGTPDRHPKGTPLSVVWNGYGCGTEEQAASERALR